MKILEIFSWGILGLFIIYIVWLWYGSKFDFITMKSRLADHSNFFVYVSVLVAVLGTCIALAAYNQSVKKPEFKVTIVNEQGEYSETMGGNIFLEKYSNNEMRYGFSVPTTWKLNITNTGERSAKNVIVKLIFDNISFENEYIYEFTLSNHQRGIGGYQGLIYDEINLLLPGESVDLPYLPLEGQAHINNSLESSRQIDKCKMTVQIYCDDENKYIKEYSVDIKKPEHGEYEIEYNGYKKMNDILRTVHDTNTILNSEFTSVDYPVEIPESINDADVKFAYYYCLGKINSKQETLMTQYSLWFGREYYYRLLKDAKLAEEKVRNDIWVVKAG
ncbi:hypothetical protein ACQCN2_11090 [Brevibacillus ginsengisoli]|uniref:hypothetical protein n=1 Tax=Brevibacillus ginsengisoli TaxID=363854 RepID=UPI003CE6CE0E